MTLLGARRSLATLGATILLSGVVVAPAGLLAQMAGPYGHNLVVNGDAEANVGAPDADHVVKPSGWTTTGEFTAVQYGSPGGFPDKTSPGPANRGKNDFEGGNVPKSTATQTISLAAAATDIAAGSVRYSLGAWLGGYSNQGDYATVTVSFQDANGASLGGATIGPVTAAQRKSVTGLLQRAHSGTVPKGAASAVVTIALTRTDGTYDDGSADNVTLVLKKAP